MNKKHSKCAKKKKQNISNQQMMQIRPINQAGAYGGYIPTPQIVYNYAPQMVNNYVPQMVYNCVPQIMIYPMQTTSLSQANNPIPVGQETYARENMNNDLQVPPVLNGSVLLPDIHLNKDKEKIIECMYPYIYNMYPNFVSNITDMLYKKDNSELLLMAESQEIFNVKVKEIVDTLSNVVPLEDNVRGTSDNSELHVIPNHQNMLIPKTNEAMCCMEIYPQQQEENSEKRKYPLVQSASKNACETISSLENNIFLYMLKNNRSFKTKVEEMMMMFIDSCPSEKTKELFKHCLFPFIKSVCHSCAETITSMLLKHDDFELRYMLNHTEYLFTKVVDTIGILLDTVSKDQQDRILTECLYPVIELMYPDSAGAITKMLLKQGKLVVLQMLKDSEFFKCKIEEAQAETNEQKCYGNQEH